VHQTSHFYWVYDPLGTVSRGVLRKAVCGTGYSGTRTLRGRSAAGPLEDADAARGLDVAADGHISPCRWSRLNGKRALPAGTCSIISSGRRETRSISHGTDRGQTGRD